MSVALHTTSKFFFKFKIWFTSEEKILIARLGTWLRNAHIFGGKLVYTNLSSNIVLSQKGKKLSGNMTHKCNPISDDCIQCIHNDLKILSIVDLFKVNLRERRQ